MEEWRDVVGFEGLYEVSSLGRVKRLPFIDATGKLRGEKIADSPFYSWGNYKNYKLIKDGKATGKVVHRIVAEAFIPNPDNKPLVNHKNFLKQDNRAENLEWVTPSENSYHAVHGKLPENVEESYEYKKYLKLKAKFAYLDNATTKN